MLQQVVLFSEAVQATNPSGVLSAANVLQALAIFFGLLGVAASILWSNIISSKRATFDLILSEMLDPRQVEMRKKFTDLRDKGNLVQYANEKAESDEASIISANLGVYEMIAIGVKKKFIDERSYKDWCRTTLVRDWCECKTYVNELRKQSKVPTYYCEFEWLAKRWSNGDEVSYC